MVNKDFLPLGGRGGGTLSRALCLVAWLLVGGQCLAQGSISAGQSKAAVCAACHGADGNSINPLWPSLAGQHPGYLAHQLMAFKAGDREDPLMSSFAAPLSDQDIADLAVYFASQTLTTKGADPALVDLGERIYRAGDTDRSIPACIACHGPAGQGNPLAGYPVIAGQQATYIENTLMAYASGARRSDAAANPMMRDIASRLSEDEMQAVASYMQGLH